jgi:cation:H+ antiporter
VATVAELAAVVVGVVMIVWGAEEFAEHLAGAARRLGVTTFALAVLLAGAEPEELATSVTSTVRHSPAIALGDVIGANVAICLVALGVGAVIAVVPFGRRVRRYAVLSLPIGAIAVWFSWDGRVDRVEGGLLVALYLAYVLIIWRAERRPPALGETAELTDGLQHDAGPARGDLLFVLAGVVAMIVGASVLVEGVRRLASAESSQAKLSLTIVGFATAFELVVLAWSAARRGIGEAVVAGVVGSYAYNASMTLGVAAFVRPLQLSDAGVVRAPAIAMLGALGLTIGLTIRRGQLARTQGLVLLAAYPAYIALVVLL